MKASENIKFRIIIPLFVVLVLLLSVYLYALHWNQKQLINKFVNYKFEKLSQIFNSHFEQEARKLDSIVKILATKKDLLDSWQSQDRDKLYKQAEIIYKNTLKKNGITHFYFINPDGTCFLRVHFPDFYGDKINRLTLKKAITSQKGFYGLELGPLGHFALRYVYPVKYKGSIIGYIELGQDIHTMFDNLYEKTGLNFYFILYKRFLDKSKWKKGLNIINSKQTWEEHADFVLICCHEKYPLNIIKTYFKNFYTPKNLNKVFFNSKNHNFCVKQIPIRDVANETIGEIIAIDDITTLQLALKSLTFLLIVIGVWFSALLFLFFFFYLRHVETNIKKAESNLIEQNKLLIAKEKELRESNLKIQTISDNALDGIIMINDEGKVSYWNKAAERIFGYTEKEVIQSDMHFLLSPEEYHHSYISGFEKFKNQGKGKAIGKILELTAVKKDGTLFPIELSLASIEIDGKWNAIGILRDITERKYLDKIRQNFIATLSHDLRVPLLAENHTLKYMLKGNYGELTEKQATAVKNMINSNNGQLDLVNILLDVYKLEADSLEIFKEPVEISKLVNEAILELLPLVETNNKIIKSSIPEEFCILDIDRNYIKRVLINIINNAINYTPDNSIIEVTASKAEGFLTLTIRDNGHGISDEEIDKIFDRYYTSSKKFRKIGTGLGLYLSKQIILLHGGDIWVESCLNEGTTFSFTLPL